ncbi:MAG: penicillin-binding protein activator [Magnetococcus sp. MYC-9]
MLLLGCAGLLWGCAGQKPLVPAAQLVPARGANQEPAAGKAGHLGKEAVPVVSAGQSAQGEVRKGESQAEVAILQGQLLFSQGMLREAWQQWAPVAQGSVDPAEVVYGETAWVLLFESYLKQGDRDNTPRFLQEIANTEPTAQQHRRLQELLQRQARPRLQELLQLQPPGSSLTPLFQQAMLTAPSVAAVDASASLLTPSGQAQPPIATPVVGERSSAALKVGLLLPLSGKSASMGEHLRRAAKKALADYPAASIQLQIADSGDTADTVRAAVRDLLGQQVDVVVGPVFYATVLPAVEEAVARRVPIITLNPQREGDPPNPGVFSNALQPEQQAKIMARYAVQEKRFAHIAVLAPETEYGRGVAKSFADEVQALGGAVVKSNHFPPEATDFSPWLKSLGPQVDALFLPAPARQVRLIAPQVALVRSGKAKVTLLGTALWNSPELLSEGTDYLNGAIFCDMDTAAREQFRQSFRQSWEEDPSPLAALAYDGVAVIAQLLQEQRQGGIAWQSGLTRANGFQGANGPVRFLENGRSRRFYHLFQVANGQMQRLQPVADSLNIP